MRQPAFDGFDVSEWYLRHRGNPVGPFNLDELRSMATAGRVSEASFVQLGPHGPWQRLDTVIDSVAFAAPSPESLPAEEPIVASFSSSRWRAGLVESALALVVIGVLSVYHGRLDFSVAATLISIESLVSAVVRPVERIDFTARTVVMSKGLFRYSVNLNEIDPTASAPRLWDTIFGVRSIRSTSGRALTIGRWLYRPAEYEALMQRLGLDS